MVHQRGAPPSGVFRWLAALLAATLVPSVEGRLLVKHQALRRSHVARPPLATRYMGLLVSSNNTEEAKAPATNSTNTSGTNTTTTNATASTAATNGTSTLKAPAATNGTNGTGIIPCPAGINGTVAIDTGCTPTMPPTTSTTPPPTTTLFQGVEARIVVAGLPLGVTNEVTVRRIASDVEFQVANSDWRGKQMKDFFEKYGANQSQQLPPPVVSMNIGPLPPPPPPPTLPPTTTPKPKKTLKVTTPTPKGGHPTTKASDNLLKLTTTTTPPPTPPPADDAPPQMMKTFPNKKTYDSESAPEQAVEKVDANGNKLSCADGLCTNEAGEIVPDPDVKAGEIR